MGERLTYQEIGEILGISGERVRQLDGKAMEKLRKLDFSEFKEIF